MNRLSDASRYNVNIFEAKLDDLKNLHKETLCFSLYRFIPEVTKLDGKDYPGKTLYQTVVSIQKHLNQNNIVWKLLDDPSFIDAKSVLDNVMKERASANIGMVRRQAEIITCDPENELWRQDILGEDIPDKLRDTVLFALGINLVLRGGGLAL